jgi:CubicO group peptidase (beta-lactamase class C family)
MNSNKTGFLIFTFPEQHIYLQNTCNSYLNYLKSFFIIVIIYCLAIGNIYSQSDKSRVKEFALKYDAYIQRVAGAIPEIPSVAAVVIKNDKPVFLKVYGYADKEAGIKADINSLYYISSSTKSFTGLVAAMLDEEGIIKLNEPVIKYANGITFKSSIPEKITVQNLLTHTSGLGNDILTFRMAYSGETETKDINRIFGEKTRYTDSNYNRYKYDNIGYNIYGILLRQSIRKKWQDLLEERIFKPLKMQHSVSSVSKAVSNKFTIAYPHVYTPDKGEIRSWLEKTDSNMHAAGGIFTSISDIGIWLNMNMNGGKLHGKQVFPVDLIQKVQTGYTTTQRELAPFAGTGEYGLGWQIGNYKNEKVIYHHGGYTGYQSHVSFFPDKKIAVAVFVNDGTVGARACHMIATYAYDWWLQVENMGDSYAKQLQELAEQFEAGKKAMAKSFTDRAKRTWQLSLPLESYTGKYYNSSFGTMEILIYNNTLVAKLGSMRSVSAPFTEKETIRIELIPNEGKIMKFKMNSEDKPEAVTWEGIEFRKVE